jgi:hypothetical protein
MEEHDELRVPFSEEELARLRRVAKAEGTDPESWAKEVLLRWLEETTDDAEPYEAE